MTRDLTPQDAGWMGAPRRGASHGRPSNETPTLIGRVTLRRIRINSGGYDDMGAYWGIGAPLYGAMDDADWSLYFRAADRADAKAIIRETHPDARFTR
jgi:hypothetical protein